jgi:hypothetical protein
MPSLDSKAACPVSLDHSVRRAMALVAALFFVKAVWLAFFVTPLWDVPDETGHYCVIADIADGRGLPLPGKSVIAPDVAADWAPHKSLSPEEKWNWVAQHPPLYHLLAVPLLQAGRLVTPDPHWRYRAPRLLSALSGAAALLVFFEVFAEASGDPFFAFVAASAVGVLPMFSHMSSGTNHDVFLALLCGIAALFWVRLARKGQLADGRKMAFALALAGAVKFSALVLAAALLLLAFPFLPARGWRRLAQWLAMGALAFLLPALWTFRQWILLGNARVHPVSSRPFDLRNFVAYLRDNPVVDHTFKNFVGLIGWTGTGGGDVRWFQISGAFLAVWFLLTLATAAWTAFFLWTRFSGKGGWIGRGGALVVFAFCFLWLFSAEVGTALPKRLLYSLLAAAPLLAIPALFRRDSRHEAVLLGSHAVFLLFTAAYLVNSWEAYAIYGQMRATNGRYFFAVLPFLVLAFCLPFARFFRPTPRRDAVLAVVLAALFVNETAFFLFRVVPFYRAAPSSILSSALSR